jgi:hypothetical protein
MSKKKIPTLIIEHVSDRGNLHLLSLLEHRRDRYLVIVDNITEDEIAAYVLDYAQQEGIDLGMFLDITENWLETSEGKYPLSFEFSRLGLTSVTRRIYKTFDLAYVTRLVGKAFTYEMSAPTKVRRRRAAKVPAGVEIRPKATVYSMPTKV